jgi:iron-sulfur cluster assembly protein
MIHLSPRAAAEIHRRQNQQRQPDSHLRLKVLSGGCQGLRYEMDLVAEIAPDEQVVRQQGIAIALSDAIAPQIAGLQIDFADDLMGGAFQFQNPQAVKVCDCGNSFAIASSNDQEWQVDCGL